MLTARCTTTNLRHVQEVECSSVVIYDRYRNPLAVVVEIQPGVELIYDRSDPDFAVTLRNLGLGPVGETKILSLGDLPNVQRRTA